MATTQPRILLVEDDFDVSSAVRRGLRLAGFAVDAVSDGRAALSELDLERPDLLVLDLMLPDVDGIALCRKLRAQEQAAGERPLPVLMLTARDAVADRVEGLSSGADDYLVKPFAFEELLARIQALLRRSQPPPGEESDRVLRFSDVVMDLDGRTVHRGAGTVHLSAREFDLLELFLQHPNQVLTRALLMDRFWSDYFGESNVLEVMLASLRHALEVGGDPRLIHTVRGVGYVLRVDG